MNFERNTDTFKKLFRRRKMTGTQQTLTLKGMNYNSEDNLCVNRIELD